ncbi:MAG: EpsG family protein [Ruminococcus sp.]|nr:EpsG family protein [Ruminococcus sp.]
MTIYLVLFALLILNGILFGRDRRKFVFISFALMTLVAALRGTSVGIDVDLHYASNFTAIANADWSSLSFFTGNTGYDWGFVTLCKLFGMISDDPQIFLFATSLIIYSSIGRYIYRQSDDAVLETYVFFTSFLYFMTMNIVAQALAIAVVLLAVDFLAQKKYIRCLIFMGLAIAIHSSAIVCLIFIPISFLKMKRSNVAWFTVIAGVVMVLFNQIVYPLASTFLPGYTWYFGRESGGRTVGFSAYSLFWIITYLIPLVLAIVYIYLKGHMEDRETRLLPTKVQFNRKKIYIGVNGTKTVEQVSVTFLTYMTIISVMCKVLYHAMEIVNRLGYYEYLFAFTLLGCAVNRIDSFRNRRIVKAGIYLFMGICFLYFCASAGEGSYGVVPYQFFWE